MVVNNKTYINGEKANQILLKTEFKSTLSQFILGPIIAIAGLAVFIYGCVLSDVTNIVFGSLFFLIGVAYLTYAIVSYKKAPKRIYEKNKDICEYGITYNYKIKEQSIFILIEEKNKNRKIEYSYNDLKKKVYEYDDYYEIASKEGLILYFSKAGFENPRMEEFFKKNLSINKVKFVKKINKTKN